MLMKLTPIWGLTRQISPLNLCGNLKNKIDKAFCKRHTKIELFTVERILYFTKLPDNLNLLMFMPHYGAKKLVAP